MVWCGMVWYGMVEVCEGAPAAVSGWVLTVFYLVSEQHGMVARAKRSHWLRRW